nr:cholesterol 7-desaturase nvd-like [Dermacentor andersoni]
MHASCARHATLASQAGCACEVRLLGDQFLLDVACLLGSRCILALFVHFDIPPLHYWTRKGQEFVAVRCEDGTARVFDAYCPHLGAHLGMMGRVAGDIIECPFHGWKFDCKSGSCTHVPYFAKAPSFAKVNVWMSKELLGLVFVWYHADGKAPSWDVPEDILSRTLESKSTGRFEHSVHCHIQDIAENGADSGHFNKVHKASSLVNGTEFEKNMGESWKGRLFQHQWVATWSPNKHEAMVVIEAFISILGWKPDYLRHQVEARQVHPNNDPPWLLSGYGVGLLSTRSRDRIPATAAAFRWGRNAKTPVCLDLGAR